jgi:hypothetical protein
MGSRDEMTVATGDDGVLVPGLVPVAAPAAAPKPIVPPVVALVRSEDEGGIEGAPLAFNTGIAEVELPISFKLKNIEVGGVGACVCVGARRWEGRTASRNPARRAWRAGARWCPVRAARFTWVTAVWGTCSMRSWDPRCVRPLRRPRRRPRQSTCLGTGAMAVTLARLVPGWVSAGTLPQTFTCTVETTPLRAGVAGAGAAATRRAATGVASVAASGTVAGTVVAVVAAAMAVAVAALAVAAMAVAGSVAIGAGGVAVVALVAAVASLA